MSQIVLHRQDSTTTEEKLATNSLSFKSINGSELKDFNDVNGQYSNLLVQFRNITKLQQRLLNVISNYKQAVALMDGLYGQLYLMGTSNSSGSLTQKYNQITANVNKNFPVRFPKMTKKQLEDTL
jgi:hypothetical protein